MMSEAFLESVIALLGDLGKDFVILNELGDSWPGKNVNRKSVFCPPIEGLVSAMNWPKESVTAKRFKPSGAFDCTHKLAFSVRPSWGQFVLFHSEAF